MKYEAKLCRLFCGVDVGHCAPNSSTDIDITLMQMDTPPLPLVLASVYSKAEEVAKRETVIGLWKGVVFHTRSIEWNSKTTFVVTMKVCQTEGGRQTTVQVTYEATE